MTNRSKRSKRNRDLDSVSKRIGLLGAALAAAVAIIGISFLIAGTSAQRHAPPATHPSLANGLEFTDVEAQMKEFIAYNESIKLSPQQESVKKAALERRKAVCCDDYTAYTCCCNCNLSKSLWGLSNYLIAVKGMNADQVAEAAGRWIDFTNPSGYTGNACYTGGCGRAPHANGCGGMDASDIVA